jgi:hypothetical protein
MIQRSVPNDFLFFLACHGKRSKGQFTVDFFVFSYPWLGCPSKVSDTMPVHITPTISENGIKRKPPPEPKVN